MTDQSNITPTPIEPTIFNINVLPSIKTNTISKPPSKKTPSKKPPIYTKKRNINKK